MTGNPQTQSFTYDSLNRLTSAQATGGTIGNYAQQSYTYNASTGNLASKAGVNYGYNDAAHAHAVTHLGGVQKYWYDANGNQTKRIIGADTYDLKYDAENRLVEVKKNSSVYATFVYNADGQRVKSTVNGVSIAYVGSYAEWSNSALTSYYYAGAAQIAMRQSGELIYMFGDHLGSTSKTYKVSNGETKMQLYYPWGDRRYPTAASEISTRYRYTGQYEYSEFGLYFYQSRWYDASLGRFAQADTIVPLASQGVQALDRYAYVNNSPLNFVDPTGHDVGCSAVDPDCAESNALTEKAQKEILEALLEAEKTMWLHPFQDPLAEEFGSVSEYLPISTQFEVEDTYGEMPPTGSRGEHILRTINSINLVAKNFTQKQSGTVGVAVYYNKYPSEIFTGGVTQVSGLVVNNQSTEPIFLKSYEITNSLFGHTETLSPGMDINAVQPGEQIFYPLKSSFYPSHDPIDITFVFLVKTYHILPVLTIMP